MEKEPARGVARQINPEAGSHLVSLDPQERAAAVAATARSWQEFPYYAQRYGSRGWKFSLSDSGWLETLPDLGAPEACAQIRWLASVLAARGMPSFLLERHLEVLREELAARVGDGARRFERLETCRDALRDERRRHLPDDTLRSLAEAFETRAGSEPGRVANFGIVLAAAVADERAGLSGAVESLIDWATDGERFSPSWCAACVEAIAAARRAAAARPA